MIKAALFSVAAVSVDSSVVLANFEKTNTLKWVEENDPVMGGVSFNCTFNPRYPQFPTKVHTLC